MRIILQILSGLALLGTIIPCFLFFGDRITLDQLKLTMLISTLAWFAVTPAWMGRRDPAKA